MNYATQMKIANNLRLLRQMEGLTQNQLAEHLSVGRSAIALLESGRKIPDINLLYRLSQFYNIPMEAILELDTDFLVRFALRNHSFSTSEKKLLVLYRHLPPYAKGQLMERAELLSEGYHPMENLVKK